MDNFSNLITPPDFIERSSRHSVLLIDPDWSEVETLALFLKTSKNSFDVYVYRETEMNDQGWLLKAETIVDAIVINTNPTDISVIKDKFAVKANAWYYGGKNFLTNKHRIEQPVDYFVQYESETTKEKEIA